MIGYAIKIYQIAVRKAGGGGGGSAPASEDLPHFTVMFF